MLIPDCLVWLQAAVTSVVSRRADLSPGFVGTTPPMSRIDEVYGTAGGYCRAAESLDDFTHEELLPAPHDGLGAPLRA